MLSPFRKRGFQPRKRLFLGSTFLCLQQAILSSHQAGCWGEVLSLGVPPCCKMGSLVSGTVMWDTILRDQAFCKHMVGAGVCDYGKNRSLSPQMGEGSNSQLTIVWLRLFSPYQGIVPSTGLSVSAPCERAGHSAVALSLRERVPMILSLCKASILPPSPPCFPAHCASTGVTGG